MQQIQQKLESMAQWCYPYVSASQHREQDKTGSGLQIRWNMYTHTHKYTYGIIQAFLPSASSLAIHLVERLSPQHRVGTKFHQLPFQDNTNFLTFPPETWNNTGVIHTTYYQEMQGNNNNKKKN